MVQACGGMSRQVGRQASISKGSGRLGVQLGSRRAIPRRQLITPTGKPGEEGNEDRDAAIGPWLETGQIRDRATRLKAGGSGRRREQQDYADAKGEGRVATSDVLPERVDRDTRKQACGQNDHPAMAMIAQIEGSCETGKER